MMRATVLVLGDVGRSPRMQYHALSLANSNKFSDVYLVGYHGESCFKDVTSHPAIELCLLQPALTNFLPRSLLLLYAPLKIFQQTLQILLVFLFTLPTCEYILVQNPPCIPTFLIVSLIHVLKGSRVVIDWHNLGYSILETNFNHKEEGEETLLTPTRNAVERMVVWIAKLYEHLFGLCGYKHLCVSKALKKYLLQHVGVPRIPALSVRSEQVAVMYDRAPSHFQPLSVSQKHRLFYKLGSVLFDQGFHHEAVGDIMETPFTKATVLETEEGEADAGKGGKGQRRYSKQGSEYDKYSPSDKEDKPCVVKLKKAVSERPFLIISSTSYTADEDFSLLLSALKLVDTKIKTLAPNRSFPAILCVVTGKGPLKEHYAEEIRALSLKTTVIKQVWLETDDYPALLGAADLGVSLHTSSSGIDLPMKVVDMFGAGLPVCAYDFQCISELVKSGRTGLLFKTQEQLARQLLSFIKDCLVAQQDSTDKLYVTKLKQLKIGVLEHRRRGWEEEWKEKADAVFEPFVMQTWSRSVYLVVGLAIMLSVVYLPAYMTY